MNPVDPKWSGAHRYESDEENDQFRPGLSSLDDICRVNYINSFMNSF